MSEKNNHTDVTQKSRQSSFTLLTQEKLGANTILSESLFPSVYNTIVRCICISDIYDYDVSIIFYC